jgi:hypothetical protein
MACTGINRFTGHEFGTVSILYFGVFLEVTNGYDKRK